MDMWPQVDDFNRDIPGILICSSPSCGGDNLSYNDEATCVDCFHQKCDVQFIKESNKCDPPFYACLNKFCPFDRNAEQKAYCDANMPACNTARGKCFNKARTTRCKCNASCVGKLNKKCSSYIGQDLLYQSSLVIICATYNES